MTRFRFGAMSLCGRFVFLSVPLLLAVAAPAAHGQGRGFHGRPFMMRSTTPAITPAMRGQLIANAQLRRDNSLLFRNDLFRNDLFRNQRLDRFLLRRELGLGPWWGGSTWGGTWGGGWGSGGVLILGDGTSGTTAPV